MQAYTGNPFALLILRIVKSCFLMYLAPYKVADKRRMFERTQVKFPSNSSDLFLKIGSADGGLVYPWQGDLLATGDLSILPGGVFCFLKGNVHAGMGWSGVPKSQECT